MSAYCYLFYKLYKFWDGISIPSFLSDAKAILTIIVLQGFTVLSLLVYYKLIFDKNRHLLNEKWVYIFIGFVCFILNFFFFYHKDRWKEIVTHYDKWPKNKNSAWDGLVGLLILVIIANFIIACYLYKIG